MAITLGLILFALLCAWLISFTSESKLKKSLEKTVDISLYQSQFRCVGIIPGESCCGAAMERSGELILLKDAPSLPLKGCNVEQCNCKFAHQEDRCTGQERRIKEETRRKPIYGDKRLVKDRRKASIKEYLLPNYRQYY